MAAGETLALIHAGHADVTTSVDAVFDERNNQVVLDFDDTTNEQATFQWKMPQTYDGGGVDVILHLTMSSATTGDVDLDAQFERQTGLDLDTNSFAAVQSTNNTTVPATSGEEFTVTVSFTDGAQMDSVTAGDMFRLRVTRDAASDTATGDMELRFVEIREQ